MRKVILSLVILFLILSINNGISGNKNISIDNLTEFITDFEINGDTIIVDQGGSGDYTKIQDAINHSKDRDTIHIYSGNYTELLTINRSISLIGIGDPLLYHVEKDTTNILITSDNVNIKNISIENKNDGNSPMSKNIFAEASFIDLFNVNCLGDFGFQSSNKNNFTIRFSRFNCTESSMHFEAVNDLIIKDNIFVNYLNFSTSLTF